MVGGLKRPTNLHKNHKICEPVYLGGVPLEYVLDYKYLGVTFETSDLNFGVYLKKVLSKMKSRSVILRAIGLSKDGSRPMTSQKLYKALVRPLSDYAAQALYFTQTYSDKIDSQQAGFFKTVLGLESTTSSAAIRMLLGLESAKCRADQLKMQFHRRLKFRKNSIVNPILDQMPGTRGYNKEIEDIHEYWQINPSDPPYTKIDTIGGRDYSRDLELLRGDGVKRQLLYMQYGSPHPGAANQKRRPNNILKLLDRTPRKERACFFAISHSAF